MTKPRFTITLTHYHWSCGSGCCSDSGYKLYVIDNQPEIPGYGLVDEESDWRFNRYPNFLLKRGIESVQNKLGYKPIENVDYEVIEKEQDNDQDYEE